MGNASPDELPDPEATLAATVRLPTAADPAAPAAPLPVQTRVAKDAAPDVPALPPPERLEHFEVLRREDDTPWELGRGAMGVTYKALDTRLHSHVALKVINADLLDRNPALRARFLREARAAARLRHPNVATVFHLSEGGGPTADPCFYAMEFIEGETLESRVRRRGPLSVPLALELALQVTRALIAAAQQGLVHRDLKPANLMLQAGVESGGGPAGSSAGTTDDAGAWVKVIDFGLAKAITDGSDLTGVNVFIGTPQFASPEQVTGGQDRDGAPLDARTDIYSLGATLWYALLGKVPFPGRNLSEIHDRQLAPPPLDQLRAVGVPPPVADLLESMLAIAPADRPQTPYALADALRQCRGALTVPPPETSGDTVSLRPGRGGEAAAGLVLPLAERRRQSTRRRRLVILSAAGVALLLALAGAGSAFWRSTHRSPVVPTPVPAATPEPAVAVLPFQNLSSEPDNAFFADGIQDDVLTSLTKVRELKVISRTSVQSYRDTVARGNLRELGQTLGVTYFLEGTVRRAGNRVLVSVKLTDARNDRLVWAEKYDRTLADAITLQGELATEIAGALRMSVSPEEKARIMSPRTGSAEAYVLFLRGREAQTRAAFARSDYEGAEKLFEQAVALDATFALAWARLSQTRCQIVHFYEPTPARQAGARAAAETALRLAPDLGEAHLAAGVCYYWLDRDRERARPEFEKAARDLPNDADVAGILAAILRHQGRWAESTAALNRALTLNPRNADLPYELATNYAALGDWPAAARMADMAVALAPDAPVLKLWRGDLLSHWQGDLGPLKAALAEMPAGSEKEELPGMIRYQVALTERDFAAAERALAACAVENFTTMDYGAPKPRALLEGMIYLARNQPGDAERARACFEVSRVTCEAAVQQAPSDPYRHARLGLVYAALGWRDPALGQGWRAAELLPESKDVSEGPTITTRRAQIYALLGDADGALPLIEHLLRTPNNELLTVHDLRIRPDWDGLRGDARFQRLVAAGGR